MLVRFPKTVAKVMVFVLIFTGLSFLPAHSIDTRTCAQGGACVLGDPGPGGGTVFYVASGTFTQVGATGDMCSTDCKYLEAAPTSGNNSGSADWKDADYAWSGNTSTLIGATAQATAIGTGYANTLAIVGQSSGGNTAGKAGTASQAYRGPNNKTDWFLPSKDELNAMCNYSRTWTGTPSTGACTGAQNGPFAAGTYGFASGGYWSSSQGNAHGAWDQYFDGGSQFNGVKYATLQVRPVRAF